MKNNDTEIILNNCYGGFSFSRDFVKYVAQLYNWTFMILTETEQLPKKVERPICYYWYNLHSAHIIFPRFWRGEHRKNARTNPKVIAALKAFGEERASGPAAQLRISYGSLDRIRDYDGIEECY